MLIRPSLGLACLIFSAAAQADPYTGEEIGELTFPVSTDSAAVQDLFERGMLLLHSFEYEDARTTFREVRDREPDLAIAAWAEALTHYRPIWRQEDVSDAQTALTQLAPTAAERARKAGSDVERGLLGAVEVLFGDGDRVARWTGYRDTMAQLAGRHPFHIEVGALYTLSILGTSFDGRDTRTYMRAAAEGEQYFIRAPRHPGLLHYLIHSYDDPIHAPLGLRMARVYDRVAPGAEHALHMPSHIYLALGMWPETVASNQRSIAAADLRRDRLQLDANARGWHAFLWKAYAHLQLGETDTCRDMLAECGRFVDELPSQRIRFHYMHLRAVYAVDTRDFDDVLVTRTIDRKGTRRQIGAFDRWVEGMTRIGGTDKDAARVQQILSELDDVSGPSITAELATAGDLGTSAATCCVPSTTDSGGTAPSRGTRLAYAVASSLLRATQAEASGQITEAESMYRQAAALEDAMDLDFGPPESVPAHEELAGVPRPHRTPR